MNNIIYLPQEFFKLNAERAQLFGQGNTLQEHIANAKNKAEQIEINNQLQVVAEKYQKVATVMNEMLNKILSDSDGGDNNG